MTFRARVLLALPLALLINVVVAWTLTLIAPRTAMINAAPLADEADERLWWLGQVPERWGLPERGARIEKYTGTGVVEIRTAEALGEPPDGGYRTAAGWPFASFMGGAGLHNRGWGLLLPSLVPALPLPEVLPSRQSGRASLPIQPRWRGLLANTIVWSVVALPIVSLPGLRRWWHRHLQRCPSCGYPLLPTQHACPECGTWRNRWSLRTGAAALLGPSSIRRRDVVRLAATSVAAGMLSTVALALVAAIWSPVRSIGTLQTVPSAWTMTKALPRWPPAPRRGDRLVGPGFRVTLLSSSAAPVDWQRQGPDEGTPVPLLCRESVVEAGWPVPAFRGMQARHVSFFVDRLSPPGREFEDALAIPLVLRSAAWSEDRVIPLRPLWGGLALDVLLFAACSMTAALLTKRWCRAWRAARARCGQCGFPTGESKACPECGTPVGQARVAPDA